MQRKTRPLKTIVACVNSCFHNWQEELRHKAENTRLQETEGEKPLVVETIDLDATIPADTYEDATDVIILDDEVLSFPGDWPEAISTPKVEVASGYKQPSEDTSPHLSPPKK